LGQGTEEHLEFFAQKARSLSVEEHGTAPAEVYVELLSRLGRVEEALEAAAELIPAKAATTGFAPSLLELASRSGRYDRLKEISRRRGDVLGFVAGLLEDSAGAAAPPPQQLGAWWQQERFLQRFRQPNRVSSRLRRQQRFLRWQQACSCSQHLGSGSQHFGSGFSQQTFSCSQQDFLPHRWQGNSPFRPSSRPHRFLQQEGFSQQACSCSQHCGSGSQQLGGACSQQVGSGSQQPPPVPSN